MPCLTMSIAFTGSVNLNGIACDEIENGRAPDGTHFVAFRSAKVAPDTPLSRSERRL